MGIQTMNEQLLPSFDTLLSVTPSFVFVVPVK